MPQPERPIPRFVGVALRCVSAACRRHLSPQRRLDLSSPSLGRVPWGGFPGVSGTTGRSDSSRSSARPSVSLGRAYLGWMVGSLPERAHPGPLEAWSFVVRGTVPVTCGGDARRLTFLGNPWRACPVLRPRSSSAPGHHGAPVLPSAYVESVGIGDAVFRGSVARPANSLSTLHVEGHPSPRKTRFRLVANLGRTGLVTRRVPMKGFRSILPPFPS